MFNDDAFSKIKKGARIVNVARGGVIDDAALARALDSGAVAQASTCTVAGRKHIVGKLERCCAVFLWGLTVVRLAAKTVAAPAAPYARLHGTAPSLFKNHARVSTFLLSWH